jgi:exonuclease SbcC
LAAAVASAPSAGDARATLDRIAALDAAEATARAAHERTATALTEAVSAVAALDTARAYATTAYHRARDRFVVHGPPPPAADIVVSWDALVAWATAEADRQTAAADAADADVAAARAARATHQRGLDDRFASAGVTVTTTHREALSDARAMARQRVVAIDAAIVERSRLEAELTQRGEVVTVNREMARLLSARGFERWLVAEALTQLVAGASLTLRQLSGDQYSLALDDNGEFAVVDHANADERRGVRTLSGGETFQASLALALALADHLANSSARGPAKLDAIFLDEGFGTLDAESLETVAATIESLGDGRRTVGIVTHVRELADRVPVRFEVAKGLRTSTVERVER